jgi:hypothetical protein
MLGNKLSNSRFSVKWECILTMNIFGTNLYICALEFFSPKKVSHSHTDETHVHKCRSSLSRINVLDAQMDGGGVQNSFAKHCFSTFMFLSLCAYLFPLWISFYLSYFQPFLSFSSLCNSFVPYLSLFCLFLSVSVFLFLSIYLSLYLSFSLYIFLSLYLSFYLSFSRSLFLSFSLVHISSILMGITSHKQALKQLLVFPKFFCNPNWVLNPFRHTLLLF